MPLRLDRVNQQMLDKAVLLARLFYLIAVKSHHSTNLDTRNCARIHYFAGSLYSSLAPLTILRVPESGELSIYYGCPCRKP